MALTHSITLTELLWVTLALTGLIWSIRAVADAQLDVGLTLRRRANPLERSIARSKLHSTFSRLAFFALAAVLGALTLLAPPRTEVVRDSWEWQAVVALSLVGAPILLLMCLVLLVDGMRDLRERKRQLELAVLSEQDGTEVPAPREQTPAPAWPDAPEGAGEAGPRVREE